MHSGYDGDWRQMPDMGTICQNAISNGEHKFPGGRGLFRTYRRIPGCLSLTRLVRG